MKKITVVLVVLFASIVSAFAQTQIPVNPSRLACQEDLLLVGSWRYSSVFEICHNKASVQTNWLMYGPSGAQQILAYSRDQFYAVGYDSATKVSFGSVESWKILSGGIAYDPDPVHDGLLLSQEQSISLRYPFELKKFKVWLRENGDTNNQNLTNQLDLQQRCAAVEHLGEMEFCLDVQTGSIVQSLDGGQTKEWFRGRNPVQMVVGKDGLFVLLGSIWNWSGNPNENPTMVPGQIVVLRTGRDGRFGEQLVGSGGVFDIASNIFVSRMAAGELGIYFLARANSPLGGYDVLWHYSYETKSLVILGTSDDGDSFGGLTVVPTR